MKKILLSLLGIKFREYPLWWKIMTMSVTALIITYTYFTNLYSHLFWLVLPIQYLIYFGFNNTKEPPNHL
jgi:hypothetical protein